MLAKSMAHARPSAFARGVSWPSWMGFVGLAMAIGMAYFLAAWLGLALLTKPDGVAVFWPAAGIASGIVIALGPVARLPMAGGVMAATIAANLLGDRNLPGAVAFALCNAGEAIIIAWLIARQFGPNFSLDSMRRVLGLFLATVIATSVSGVGGTAGFVLFHSSEGPIPTIWLNWFASDALGVVTVAPLVIGLVRTLRDLPEMSELVEGMATLVVLALVSAIAFASPTDHWFTILPLALLMPPLFWLTARCRPVFAATAVCILAVAIVSTITFGVGRLGDSGIPLADRVHAARAALLATAICGLLLTAVFAERRRHEAALKDSNDRLQLALDSTGLGVWSVELETGRFESDARDSRIHGHDPQTPPKTFAEARPFIHPDDLPGLDATLSASRRAGSSYKAEYRVAPGPDRTPAGQERWVAVEGMVLRSPEGRPVRLLGVTRDITERKQTEKRLQQSEWAFRELLGSLPAAIYVTDAAGRIIYCNQGAIDLWGATPKLGEDKWSDLSRFYHADGSPMAMEEFPAAIALKEGRAVQGREALMERADGTRIPIMPYPTPLHDRTSAAVIGVVNMTVDISERKDAEHALAERTLQLALAGQAALVGSFAYGTNTERIQISEGYAAIHGLPEGVTEVPRSQWQAGVHPEDLERLEVLRSQAFSERWGEYSAEYRIIRSGSEVRWIESRSFISYSSDGQSQRVVGVNIDVTERKRAEEHQRVLVAELDHRVKNVLATVSAIVSRTQEASSSVADFVAALEGRIKSMATTHELLSHRRWQGIPLAELVRRELAPYATNSNTEIDGPAVILSAEAGQAMAMVLHELVTNAAKYGALSSQSGRVSVRWDWRLKGDTRDRLAIDWQESGGPLVLAPSQSGYGTSAIRELVPYELGGTVDLAFARDGVQCQLGIPVDWVSGSPLSDDFNASEPAQPTHAD